MPGLFQQVAWGAAMISIPLVCVGMGALCRERGLADAASCWSTTLVLVLACNLLAVVLGAIVLSRGWWSTSGPVTVDFGEGSSFTLGRLAADGPPVEVQRDPSTGFVLGSCGSLLLLLVTWVRFLVSTALTRRAVALAAAVE